MQGWEVDISNPKIEIVSNLPSHTAFRVSLRVPKKMMNFWKDENLWPENTKVKKWNGNPDQPIPPELSRELNRKIFIGRVDSQLSLRTIENYIQTKVYPDIQQHIKSLTAVRNPHSQAARTGICLTIVMKPGVEAATALLEKGLMKANYPIGIQQTVRWWNHNLGQNWSNVEKPAPDWSL